MAGDVIKALIEIWSEGNSRSSSMIPKKRHHQVMFKSTLTWKHPKEKKFCMALNMG